MEINTKKQGKVVHIGQLLPEQLQEPVPFDLVELSEQERIEAIEIAIKEAKVKKHARLETERKKALANSKLNDARRPWSPNELYQLAKYRGTQILRYRTGNPSIEFEPVDFQKDAVTALSLYFTNASEFEELDTKVYNTAPYAFSLQKGIWLWGNPGVGKSLIMEIFNRNKRLSYDILECPKICYRYVKHGDDAINPLVGIIDVPAPDASNFYQEMKGICYNDLGTENLQSSHYGNPINVMEYIMLQTYERKIPYFQRHVTTNLTMDQVKDSYGVRMLDRIKECFNVIEIKGDSLRK